MAKINQNATTIFHITHQKAGSQWVREILKYSCPERFVTQEFRSNQIKQRAILPGKIYAATYLTYDEFMRYLMPSSEADMKKPGYEFLLENYRNFQILKLPVKCFFVIRDLRDTLVSLYFSKKISHSILSEKQKQTRDFLQNNSIEEGMLFLLKEQLKNHAKIQDSWINQGVKIIRYEELLVEPYNYFAEIVNYCEIEIEENRLHQIIENNLFKNVTGRKRGVEDVSAHQRKGISGDWKNYFTPKIISEFKKLYGNTLLNTGYENDCDW